MALGRVVLLSLCCAGALAYNVPDPTIQVATKGVRFTIPDDNDIAYFLVQGQVIRQGADQKDEFGGETGSSILLHGKTVWVVDLPDLELQVGDKLDFLAFVAVKNDGYIKDKIEKTVNSFDTLEPLPARPVYNYDETVQTTTTVKPCEPTATRVHQGSACAGQTIFEENFDTLRDDVWQVQHRIPLDHPDVPFVSYQQNAVSVKDGHLHITSSPQLNDTSASLFTPLDLSVGCTSGEARQCALDGQEAVPPVISGRVTSQPGFAFKYGTVTVRAKMPKGDWIYPEVLLEPFLKKFGIDSRNTGILQIAGARGNAKLNKKLYGGPVLDTRCHDSLLVTKESKQPWSDDFHDYSVKWTSESLVLSVDGEVYATVEPAENGLRGKLPNTCSGVMGTGTAPFDEYFYLTLGLAVGGDNEFENSLGKPWKNGEVKAPVKFWRNAETWKSTWEQPELVVDYVKVVAL